MWTINDVTEKNPGNAKPDKGEDVASTNTKNGGGFLVSGFKQYNWTWLVKLAESHPLLSPVDML